MKQLQLLNNLLTADSVHTVNFLFSPIVLPITDEGVVAPEELASKKHFTTLVFVKELDDYYVFEFDQKILDGLLAYRSRYGSMLKFEVLLSRRADGDVNMTIGVNNLNNSQELKLKAEYGKELFNKLYDAYKNKQNYIVFEMKGRK
jgi:hypothetical protein